MTLWDFKEFENEKNNVWSSVEKGEVFTPGKLVMNHEWWPRGLSSLFALSLKSVCRPVAFVIALQLFQCSQNESLKAAWAVFPKGG
jgi:hypothetical protein